MAGERITAYREWNHLMAFNVSEFRSAIDDKGLMRTNKFLVQFPIPAKIRSQLPDTFQGQKLSFFCKSMPLPGIGILTNDIYRYGYGPLERRPYGTVVNDIMSQFYVDSENMVRRWFRNWTRLIINPDTSKGINSTWSVTGQSAYEISYKEDYAVDIRITAFDPEGIPRVSVVLIEAYPNFVGDIVQDWEHKNQNMIMPVAFTFRDWYEETIGSSGDILPSITSFDSGVIVERSNSIFTKTLDIIGRIF
jgi:hypothetical protein